MTARVITDPSALGWVLDPDTGRWEWSGSGDGGGSGGGGGGAWEFIQEIDIPAGSSVSQVDIDGFSDQYRNYQIVVRNLAADEIKYELKIADINVFGSVARSNGDTDIASWDVRNYYNNSSSTVWRTDVPNAQVVPLFGIVSKNAGNDYIDNQRYRLHGEIYVDTGVYDATSKEDSMTSYRATAGAGVFTYRSQGQSSTYGRIKVFSIQCADGGFGQGQFKLYGLKRD